MSNDSEESITSEPSESSDQGDSTEEIEVIGYVAEPYEDEPLASDDGDSEEDEEEADADGLTPAVLESRFERQIIVREWFVRSVSYRWVVRWMFGYMGWDNTRPLPACVYHSLRTKYSSHNVRGYATAQQRE